jgi:Ras family protein T1
MGDEIKIVILGDPGVGKTSLILTLVTEEFTPKVPKSLNRIGISNEVSSASEVGLTYLVDYK